MTSNLGSDLILQKQEAEPGTLLTKEAMMSLLSPILKAHFRPEFINRLDDILPFLPLQACDMQKIAILQLNRLAKRFLEKDITLTWSDSLVEFLAKEGYDPLYGARPLKRLIQQKVTNICATAILKGEIQAEETVLLDIEKDNQQSNDEDDVLKLLGISPGKESGKTTEKPTESKEDMEKQVTDLEGQLKNKDGEISKLKSDLDSSIKKLSDLENVLNDLKTSQKVQSQPSMIQTSRASLSLSDYKVSYEAALSEYRGKNYNSAIYAFEELLKIDSSNSYSDNCRYWIGESYCGLNMYQRAIAEFEKVLTFFVNSNKEDAAQLKIGLCYKYLNQKDNARDAFQRLLRKYPKSGFVDLANKYLSEL